MASSTKEARVDDDGGGRAKLDGDHPSSVPALHGGHNREINMDG